MKYEEIHNVSACGEIVAALSRTDVAGTGMAVIDLVRVAVWPSLGGGAGGIASCVSVLNQLKESRAGSV